MKIEDYWVDCAVYCLEFDVKNNVSRHITKSIVVEINLEEEEIKKS